MTYATEHIASALKDARRAKSLTQRELGKKAAVPQSHISKIESGAVDFRVSSLVELARALDLELMLVPRKTVLDVLLHGAPVATLSCVSGDRMLFAFNEAFIAAADRPTLGLGFKDQLGELIIDFRPTRTKALPFFSNLLPEGHLRAYFAERAGVNPERAGRGG